MDAIQTKPQVRRRGGYDMPGFARFTSAMVIPGMVDRALSQPLTAIGVVARQDALSPDRSNLSGGVPCGQTVAPRNNAGQSGRNAT